MYRIKLKVPLAGPVEQNIGDIVEVGLDEARRFILRGLAVCEAADDKAAAAAKAKLLEGLSAEEQAQIISGKVVVTKRLGRPVVDADGNPDPNGAREWSGLYRPLTAADQRPKRPKTLGQKIQGAARRAQRKAFGPPKNMA